MTLDLWNCNTYLSNVSGSNIILGILYGHVCLPSHFFSDHLCRMFWHLIMYFPEWFWDSTNTSRSNYPSHKCKKNEPNYSTYKFTITPLTLFPTSPRGKQVPKHTPFLVSKYDYFINDWWARQAAPGWTNTMHYWTWESTDDCQSTGIMLRAYLNRVDTSKVLYMLSECGKYRLFPKIPVQK